MGGTKKLPMSEYFRVYGDTAQATIWYPRNKDVAFTHVQVSLMEVRAADDLRISYDFDRDGWKLEQAQFFSWEVDDEVRDEGWVEVGFIKAWASEAPDQRLDE